MDLYREEILQHYHNPQNFGELKDANIVINEVNKLCGDKLTLFLKVQKIKGIKKISEVTFKGNGCAISIASASMLTEAIKGKSTQQLTKISGDTVLALMGGKIAPARLKCAFLPLEAMRKAL